MSGATNQLDALLFKWYSCRTSAECAEAFSEIKKYLDSNWIHLLCWGEFDAWGCYFLSPSKDRCIYIGANPRIEPPARWINEVKFNSPEQLANKIWANHKGCVPFKRVADRIREVFGVEVVMSRENRLLKMWFGEASE
jgi:hypothetical protein